MSSPSHPHSTLHEQPPVLARAVAKVEDDDTGIEEADYEASAEAEARAEAEAERIAEMRIGHVVPARLRADLIFQRQSFAGKEYYVVKDPLCMTYFRFRPEEAYLAMLMDGQLNLNQIARRLRARFPNVDFGLRDIYVFLNQIGAGGLLNIGARSFLQTVRSQRQGSRGFLGLWARLLHGLLLVRIPLIDPSPWLPRFVHAIRFCWQPWFVCGCLAFMVWTAGLLMSNAELFAANPINFFSSSNIFLLWLSMILVKTAHEFGHATTCNRFGAEVHEMGFCLLCFTPTGYVDASDAWMMRHKRHKIYTAMAGVFTEFIIASIAAHLWIFMPDGVGRNVAFNIMVLASVNTVFFNLNPLMKFDGYYVFSDLLEIPNLRSKAISYCSLRLRRLLFGMRDPRQEQMVERDQTRIFVFYAVAAYLYMFTVIYGMSLIFARVLEPYGLKTIGLLLGVSVELSFLALPIAKTLYDAMQPNANLVLTCHPWGRLLKIVAACVLVGGIIAIIPTNYKVSTQSVVASANSEQIESGLRGHVEQVYVQTGQWVEKGQLLVRLSNDEVEQHAEEASANYELAKLRISDAGASGSWEGENLRPQADLVMQNAYAQWQKTLRDQQRLELRSPTAGYVLTPNVAELQGRSIRPGEPLLRVGDRGRYKLLVPLIESDAQLVYPGSKVVGRFHATAEPFQGHISVVPTQKARTSDIPMALLTIFGGPVPPGPNPLNNPRSGSSDPTNQFAVYLSDVPLDHAPSYLRDGMRAQVEIEGKSTTMGHRLWRGFWNLWRLKVPV